MRRALAFVGFIMLAAVFGGVVRHFAPTFMAGQLTGWALASACAWLVEHKVL